MTRKKYDKETSSEDSVSESEEEIEEPLTDEVIYGFIDYYTDVWEKFDCRGSDIFESLYNRKEPNYHCNHLTTPDDDLNELHYCVTQLCKDVKEPACVNKVIYSILHARNKTQLIYRDRHHWTNSFRRYLSRY